MPYLSDKEDQGEILVQLGLAPVCHFESDTFLISLSPFFHYLDPNHYLVISVTNRSRFAQSASIHNANVPGLRINRRRKHLVEFDSRRLPKREAGHRVSPDFVIRDYPALCVNADLDVH